MRTNRLLIGGHSLGGALAYVMALFLRTYRPNIAIDGIITFGAPRVGDWRFAKAIDSLTTKNYRFVNAQTAKYNYFINRWNYDLVPRVPTVDRVNGQWYKHAGKQVTLGYDDNTCRAPGTAGALAIRLRVNLHTMELYEARVKEHVGQAAMTKYQLCPT